MKIQTIVVSAIAAMLLIGCSEQSSVNNPIANAQHEFAKVGTPNKIHASTTFDVDSEVIDEQTGETYAVVGTISCDYTNDQGEYSFSTHASLTVTSKDAGKNYQKSINTKDTDTGKEAGQIEVLKEYKLPELPSGSFVRVGFSLAEGISFNSISLVIGQLEIEAEAK